MLDTPDVVKLRIPRRIQSSRSGLSQGPIVRDGLLGRLSFLPDSSLQPWTLRRRRHRSSRDEVA
jgi:hypothetical protein